MKIILVPASADLVGVAVHVRNLAKLLHSEGLIDIVVCPSEGWLARELAAASVPHTVLDMEARTSKIVSMEREFVRFVNSRTDADIVHLHGRLPLFVACFSILASRNRAFVATIHQFKQSDADGSLGWKAFLESALLRRMDRICCVSEDLKKEVIRRVGEKRADAIDVIPNWIEPLYSSQQPGRRAGTPNRKEARICAAGYLLHVKGFDVLLNAVGLLLSRGWTIRLDIFGKGPERDSLLSLARKLNISHLVSINEPIGELRQVLPRYDALVVSSRSESFSLVLLEAYDAGVPVVASDIPGLRQSVIRDQTGLLFEPGSAGALAQKLEQLLSSGSLADQLIANAKKHLLNYVPSQKLRSAYTDFYAKALMHHAVPLVYGAGT